MGTTISLFPSTRDSSSCQRLQSLTVPLTIVEEEELRMRTKPALPCSHTSLKTHQSTGIRRAEIQNREKEARAKGSQAKPSPKSRLRQDLVEPPQMQSLVRVQSSSLQQLRDPAQGLLVTPRRAPSSLTPTTTASPPASTSCTRASSGLSP